MEVLLVLGLGIEAPGDALPDELGALRGIEGLPDARLLVKVRDRAGLL